MKTNLSNNIVFNHKIIPIENIDSKLIYQITTKELTTNPYIHRHWEQLFKDNDINWKNIYLNLHSITDNRIKQFKFKIIHKILPTNELLHIWKIKDNPCCNHCDQYIDNYKHFFLDCPLIQPVWEYTQELFKKCGFNHNMKNLKYLIIGYKPQQIAYNEITELIALVCFSIYKSYLNCEQKHKMQHIFKTFKYEMLLKKMCAINSKTLNTFINHTLTEM